jgi:hypothetical protein
MPVASDPPAKSSNARSVVRMMCSRTNRAPSRPPIVGCFCTHSHSMTPYPGKSYWANLEKLGVKSIWPSPSGRNRPEQRARKGRVSSQAKPLIALSCASPKSCCSRTKAAFRGKHGLTLAGRSGCGRPMANPNTATTFGRQAELGCDLGGFVTERTDEDGAESQ